MNTESIKKAGELIQQKTGCNAPVGIEPYCVLGVIDQYGYPTISTITAAKADGIREITFCTGLSSNKAKRIEQCNRASVCFNNIDYNITLVGTIEILTDEATKKEMWYDGLKNNFTGSDDPNYCVLRFRTERYNLFVDWHEAVGSL